MDPKDGKGYVAETKDYLKEILPILPADKVEDVVRELTDPNSYLSHQSQIDRNLINEFVNDLEIEADITAALLGVLAKVDKGQTPESRLSDICYVCYSISQLLKVYLETEDREKRGTILTIIEEAVNPLAQYFTEATSTIIDTILEVIKQPNYLCINNESTIIPLETYSILNFLDKLLDHPCIALDKKKDIIEVLLDQIETNTDPYVSENIVRKFNYISECFPDSDTGQLLFKMIKEREEIKKEESNLPSYYKNRLRNLGSKK